MIKEYRIRPADDVLGALSEAIDTAPRTVAVFVNRSVLPRFERKLKVAVAKEPGPPKYPIRWKSAKQRKAFFASNGFGRGIPAQRTGKLAASWQTQIKNLDQGFEITTQNTSGYEQYVTGDFQQPFHADTGWQKSRDVIARLQNELTDEIIDLYFDVLDAPPGTRFA